MKKRFISCLLFLPFLLLASSFAAQSSESQGTKERPTHGEEGQDHGEGREKHGHDEGGHGHGMPHDFSDAEAWSKRFDRPERDAWQKPQAVVDLMEIEAGMKVADLGAGTGYFLSYLSTAVGDQGRVLGLDPEAELVLFMKERAEREGWKNVEPRKIPYDEPGVEAGSLHRVLVVNTWHHIEDRGAYSERLAQVLAPGGKVYIVDYTKESPSGPPPKHRLEPQQILDELALGGIEGEVVEEDLPRQFVVVGWKAENK